MNATTTRALGALALGALVLGAAEPAAAQAIYSTTQSQPWGKTGTRTTTTFSDGASGSVTTFKDDNGQWRAESTFQGAPPPSGYTGLGAAKSYTGMGRGYCPMGGC